MWYNLTNRLFNVYFSMFFVSVLYEKRVCVGHLINQQLGNYRLLRLLGRGGFAEVYLGEHVQLHTYAAIKVLHTTLMEKDLLNFKREAQTIAKLVHPYIVRVLDFDVRDEYPFLVLEYAPNDSLRERYSYGTRLPLAQVITYTNQVASALQYAHEQKVIHRDIKPENMLVGQRGEVLLSDFGIATIAHSTQSMSTQASVGTFPYMAPEQIQEYPRPASDQYSLAIVVYLWLTGEHPFRGSSSEIIAKHLSVPPVPLRLKNPELSSDVEQVVLRGLAKNPGQRFEHVSAFAHALEQASKGIERKVRISVEQMAPSQAVVPPPPPQAVVPPPPPSSIGAARVISYGYDIPVASLPGGSYESMRGVDTGYSQIQGDATPPYKLPPSLDPYSARSDQQVRSWSRRDLFLYGSLLGVILGISNAITWLVTGGNFFYVWLALNGLLFSGAGLFASRRNKRVRSGIFLSLWAILWVSLIFSCVMVARDRNYARVTFVVVFFLFGIAGMFFGVIGSLIGKALGRKRLQKY